MFKALNVLITVLSILTPFHAMAEEVLLGTVERIEEGSDIIAVTPSADRPQVAPEELVKLQSRIPGIDEIVESGRGYIDRTANGNFDVVITEGEPVIGDEVILLRGQFLNGSVPADQRKWIRMSHDDIQAAAGSNPPNTSALCTLAQMYMLGLEVEKNESNAMLLYKYAMNYNPSADCAYEYGFKTYFGDQFGKPPAYEADPQNGEKWLRYAAEGGNYDAMTIYADILEWRGQYREAERWLKRAIDVEPKVLKGTAQDKLDRVRRK